MKNGHVIKKINPYILIAIIGLIGFLGLASYYVIRQGNEMAELRKQSLELQQKTIRLEEEKLELAKKTPEPTVPPSQTPTPKPIVIATPKPERKIVPIQVNTPTGFSTLYCYQDKANEVSQKASNLMTSLNDYRIYSAFAKSDEEKSKLNNMLNESEQQFNNAKKDFCP